MIEPNAQENVTQAHGRYFAAQQLFRGIVFGQDAKLINEWLNIDINAYNNNLQKYQNGIDIQQNDVPNSKWFDLVVAKERETEHEETFKDIVIDCLSIMVLDPNGDISTIGKNLVVYCREFDNNIPQEMETEAKYRFNKWFEPKKEPISQQQQQQQQQQGQANSIYQQKSKEEIMRKCIKVIQKGEADGTNRNDIESFLMEQGIAADDIAAAYDEHNKSKQQQQQQQNEYQQQSNGYSQSGYQQNGYPQNGYQQNGYSQNNGYQQKPYQQHQLNGYQANNNKNANNGPVNYRIKQQTAVNVGSIELPDI